MPGKHRLEDHSGATEDYAAELKKWNAEAKTTQKDATVPEFPTLSGDIEWPPIP